MSSFKPNGMAVCHKYVNGFTHMAPYRIFMVEEKVKKLLLVNDNLVKVWVDFDGFYEGMQLLCKINHLAVLGRPSEINHDEIRKLKIKYPMAVFNI